VKRWREFVWDLGWWMPFLPARLRRKMFAQIQKGQREQTMEGYLDWLENTPLEDLPPGIRPPGGISGNEGNSDDL
jgi:hypothetical protein